MRTSYDVVIIGAGPAGCAAAATLARRGRAVALLERARHPRPKLCGGLLTHKTLLALGRAFGETVETLTAAGVVEWVCRRYAILHRERPLHAAPLAEPFHIVNRPALDARLAAAAQEAGADLFQDTAVMDCSPETGRVATEDGRTFAGRFVIGADGAAGRARRALGPGAVLAPLRAATAAAAELHIPRAAAPAALRDLDHPLLHLGFVSTGYGWVFPNRDRLVVGQCALPAPGERFADTLRAYFEFLGLPPAPAGLKGHPLPYGAWLTPPGRGRLLLVGDAAGLVEPTLGEGIFYAAASGILAARALDQALDQALDHDTDAGAAAPLADYAARLERTILPELRASLRLRTLMLGLLRVLGPTPLRLILATAARPLAEAVHGRRSWRWLRAKDWEI